MTVKELIEYLQTLPQDYEACGGAYPLPLSQEDIEVDDENREVIIW